jgi:hypothetical protein
MSDNSEIPVIWHMMKAVPRPEVLFLPENPSSMKEADLRNMFERASKSAHTYTVLSPDPLFPTPSTSSAVRLQ